MQTDYGETPEEYEKRTGRKMEDDLYKKEGVDQQIQKAT
jgi:hypothetical protein